MKKYFLILIVILIPIFLAGMIFISYNMKQEEQISKVGTSIQEAKIDIANAINVIVENIEFSGNVDESDKSRIEDTEENNNIVNKESVTKEKVQEQVNSTKVTTNKENNNSNKIATANQNPNKTNTTNKSSANSTVKQNTATKSNNKNTVNNLSSDTKVSNDRPHIHSTVGNCGKWFSSFDEFVAYFNSETKKWDDLYDNGKVSWDNYIKNCPVGYQNVHDCQSNFSGNADTNCGLITGDFVYQKK